MNTEIPPGCVPCEVEEHCTAWLVTFEDGRTLLLQTDYDQASFAVACGVVDSTPDWDGRPSTLPEPEQFYSLDCTDITHCPDCYLDIAE